jgi:putative ABC transport system permease protein
LRWVFIASIIAGPIAYIISYIWLTNFAYKTHLSLWIIILAGGIATIIALLTSGYETVKAALKNPVNSLRYE